MQISFYVNAFVPMVLVFATAVANLASRRNGSLNARFAAAGFAIIFAMALRTFYAVGWISGNWTYRAAHMTLLYLGGLLFLFFLDEMTSRRRIALFRFSYALPPIVGAISASCPQPAGAVAFAGFGVAILVAASICMLVGWIRAATDDRARRDGEWVLMVFTGFAAGLVVCWFHALTGLFWTVSLWYAFVHLILNVLRVREQLSNPENQLVMNNVFDVVLILDSSGMIARMNRRGYQLAGFGFASANGRGIEALISHEGLSDATRKGWLERHSWMDSGLGSSRSPSIDAKFLTIGGESIPVDVRVVKLVDLHRKVTGYIVSATDMRITHQLMKEISDREYAARDLALSESKFSRMFIFNPTGILIVDPETLRITDANPAIEEILESPPGVLPGKTLSEVGLEMDDPSFDSFIERLQMEGSIPEFAVNLRLASGDLRNCRLSAVAFDLNRVRRMLVSLADVTGQERMREALERKKKVETVGILAGGIAHDFNNILSVILGHVGLAKMRTVDQGARAPLEKAEQACLRARDMTGQLLAFSRGGKPTIGVCDTKQLIVDSAMLAASDTSVACLFDIADDVWSLKADKIQIGQVISNIVGNAVDAMERSGIVELNVRNRDLSGVPDKSRPVGLDLKPLRAAPYVEIRIHDQGPGIPASVIAHIFDPFFTTKERGTGLGLSIVFSVIQNHGGAMTVESVPGGGATFTILLLADTRPAAESAACEVLPVAGKRVLLMDDDSLVRESATCMLESLGLEVVATCDGKEALDLYEDALRGENPFSFAILDLVVPGGMSGSDCAKGMFAADPNAILFVSSGYSEDPILPRYREYGFKGSIPKPYTIEELRSALSCVLVL